MANKTAAELEIEFIKDAAKRAKGNPFKFINNILGTDIPENVVIFPAQPEFQLVDIMKEFGIESISIGKSVGNGDIEATYGISKATLDSDVYAAGISVLQVLISGFRTTIKFFPDDSEKIEKVEETMKKIADLIKKYLPSFEKVGDIYGDKAKLIGKDVDAAIKALSKKDLDGALGKINDALEKLKTFISSDKEEKKDKKADKKADNKTESKANESKKEKSSENVADKAAASQETVNGIPFAGDSIPEWMATGLGTQTPSGKVVPEIFTANGVGEKTPVANPMEQIYAPVQPEVQQPAANTIPDEIVKKYNLDKIVEIAASVGLAAGCQVIKDINGKDSLIFVSTISRIGAYIPDKSFVINMVPVIDPRTGIWPCATNDPYTPAPLELCTVVYNPYTTMEKEVDGKKVKDKVFNKDLFEAIFKYGFSGLPEDATKRESILFSGKILETNRRFVMSSIPKMKDKEKNSQIKGALIRATATVAKWEAEDGFGYGRFTLKDLDEKSMKFTMTNVGQGFFMSPPAPGITPIELEFTPELDKDGKFVSVKEGKSDIKYVVTLNKIAPANVA